MTRRERASVRSARKDATKGLPPHEARALLDTLQGQLEEMASLKEAVPSSWRCPYLVESCRREENHAGHADPLALVRDRRPLRRDVLEALVRKPSEEVFALLLQRPDVSGTHREHLISNARTREQWSSVLASFRSVGELRVLASNPAPDGDSCRGLMRALAGDRRGCVQQLFQERRRSQMAGTYWQPSKERVDLTEVVLAEGGEFARVAHAVLGLPCPSGTWSEALLLGTTRKLLTRLPEGEQRGAAAEILVALATNWEGTIPELVTASEALSF